MKLDEDPGLRTLPFCQGQCGLMGTAARTGDTCAVTAWSGSMGQVASAGDNAAMESFFALLQENVLDRRRLDRPRRAAHRDRDLDRTHLPPVADDKPASDA